jgi:hypothetical protein
MEHIKNMEKYFKCLSCKIITVIACTALFTANAGTAPTEAYRSYLRGLLAAKSGDSSSALQEYEKAISLDKNAVAVYKDVVFLY